MSFIIGLVLVLVGVGLVLKTEWIIENFGSSAWAEAKFGYSGGTRIMYKLIGTGIILIGFMLMTGLFQGFLMGTVGKIFVR